MPSPKTNYFLKRRQFRPKPASILLFLIAALVAWGLNILGQAVFPSLHWVPYLIRTSITLTADLLLALISIRLLEKNQIPAEALGLSPSNTTGLNVLLGLLIAAGTLALIEALQYAVTPYHFQRGLLDGPAALKESWSYLVGNSLEELIFRGFLLVIVSRFAGWPIAIVAIALPFGLFHLPGYGITTAGLKMVATTATYSLVFSLSYVLTRSLWTAIAVHVTSNILLHTVLGLDGGNRGIFVQIFSAGKATNYDPGFWAMITGALSMSCVLYFAVSYRLQNVTEYESVNV